MPGDKSKEQRIAECPFKVGRSVNSFEIVRLINTSDFGAVFQAANKNTGEECAFKCIWKDCVKISERLRRFEHEVVLLKKIDHPGVMKYLDHGVLDGVPFFRMEYEPGDTLEEKLKIIGTLPLRTVLNFAAEICHVMSMLENYQIVHRDISPQNVFLTNTEGMRLLDYGVALSPVLDKSVVEQELRDRGKKFLGTPGYVSPEVLVGKPYDARSDLYSLGAVMLYALTGGKLWNDLGTRELLLAHINIEVPDFRSLGLSLPPSVELLIRKLLNKDPDRRYRSGWFLLQNLRAAYLEKYGSLSDSFK